MQYLLLMYSDETGWGRLTQAEQKEWMRRYEEFARELAEVDALVETRHLLGTARAATVAVHDGLAQIRRALFREGREQVGGYFIIEAPDMNAALDWAARCPGAAHGAVEVRALGAPPAP